MDMDEIEDMAQAVLDGTKDWRARRGVEPVDIETQAATVLAFEGHEDMADALLERLRSQSTGEG
jgi:hypothetical protein